MFQHCSEFGIGFWSCQLALLGSWAFGSAIGYLGLESDEGRRASTED